MTAKSSNTKKPAEQVVKDIRRANLASLMRRSTIRRSRSISSSSARRNR